MSSDPPPEDEALAPPLPEGVPSSKAREALLPPSSDLLSLPPGSTDLAPLELTVPSIGRLPNVDLGPPPSSDPPVAIRPVRELPSDPAREIRLAFRDSEPGGPASPWLLAGEVPPPSIVGGTEGASGATTRVLSSGFERRNSLLPSPATREALGGAAGAAPNPESERVRVPPPGFVLPHDEEQAGPLSTLQAATAALRAVEFDLVVAQMNALGLRSLGFVALVLGFVGSILVYQAGVQALRIVPDTSTIGPSYLEILVRDLAASLTALMLATRVGAGIAAEIGSMRVTDQLDAFRLSRADPVVYLVAPRVLASVVMTPLLTLFGGGVALVTGTLTGAWVFDITPSTFLDPKFVDGVDLAAGFLKSVAFGLAIPVLSAHAGLYTKGGSQGVGNATTRAVVNSSLAVIILGFVIGALAEGIFGGPID